MLRIKKISDVLNLRVFTDSGDFVGAIEEANLLENKVDSWRIRVDSTGNIASYLGGAKGLVIPHQFVKAVGEVVIISRSALPVKERVEQEPEQI